MRAKRHILFLLGVLACTENNGVNDSAETTTVRQNVIPIEGKWDGTYTVQENACNIEQSIHDDHVLLSNATADGFNITNGEETTFSFRTQDNTASSEPTKIAEYQQPIDNGNETVTIILTVIITLDFTSDASFSGSVETDMTCVGEHCTSVADVSFPCTYSSSLSYSFAE